MLDNLSLLGLAPLLNLQLLIDGLLIGSIFALAAYGLALVWGVMNIKNLAQGDFVIMGGYIAFTLSEPATETEPLGEKLPPRPNDLRVCGLTFFREGCGVG
jgi:ABC-type branched-subunit amino acid transport system permease subunit